MLKKAQPSLVVPTPVILASLLRIMGVEVFVSLLQVTASWASPLSRLYAQLVMDELIIHR